MGRNVIITSFDSFVKEFPGVGSLPKQKQDLYSKYFVKGGILSLERSSKIIIYPTHLKLKAQLKDLEKQRSVLEGRVSEWKKKLLSAIIHSKTLKARKLSDPLFWRHVRKSLSDPDYRIDAREINLPTELVSEPKYRPIIEMFIDNLAYRKQLVETVRDSVIYAKDKTIARHAGLLRDFRIEIARKNIVELKKKLSDLDEEINLYKAVQAFVKNT